jgi:putative ABC transport system permease protein
VAGVDVRGVLWAEHHSAEENRRASQLLDAYRVLVGVVVVVIAGLSVLTTMAKAVSERTREIGTLRSLGFLRRQVVALFALEAALLSAVASTVGLVATLAATAALNALRISYDAGVMAQPIPLRIALMPGTWAVAAIFLAVVAALAAVVPARRAARAPIPDALTHV